MSNKIQPTYKRDISETGQVTIPHVFRDDDVAAYLIRESTDKHGREHLKLYSATDDSNN